jgi:hypothetical protein
MTRNNMTNTETNDTATALAERGAHVAPDRVTPENAATRKKSAPKGQKAAKGAKTRAVTPKKATKASKKPANPGRKATASRAESKGARILEMIGRSKGATLAEIMKATKWQAHSVRGFLSTAKKRGLKIESAKSEAGERVYKTGK